MNSKEIIEKHLVDLVEKIDVKNTTLWEMLIQFGLFNLSNVEYIKVRYKDFFSILGSLRVNNFLVITNNDSV